MASVSVAARSARLTRGRVPSWPVKAMLSEISSEMRDRPRESGSVIFGRVGIKRRRLPKTPVAEKRVCAQFRERHQPVARRRKSSLNRRNILSHFCFVRLEETSFGSGNPITFRARLEP